MTITPARRERRAAWGVLAVLAVVGAIVLATGREGHGRPTAELHADADYYYVYLPSLMRGDLDFTVEYRETHDWYHLGTTPLGRPANVFGIGPAVFDAPLFVVGHALAIATGARRDGFSAWEIWLFTGSSLVWSLGAIALAARIVRRRLGGAAPAIALIGPVVAALAGPVVYYAVRQPGYSHPVATFFATWLVERWDASYDQQGPRSLRTWLGLGALFGAAALARPQLALWGVLLARAAYDDIVARRALPRWPVQLAARWLAAGAIAAVVFAPQLVAWKLLYGSWYVVPQGPGFMRWGDACWSEVLLSSRNGLFPWAPAYAVFAIAIVVGARRMPRLAGGVIGGFLLQTLANGAVWDWWGGGSFGGRRFDSTYVLFALGAALCVAWIARAWRRGGGWRAGGVVLAAVISLCTIANLRMVALTTVTEARITGGESAAGVIDRALHGTPDARVASWLSALTNLPARAAFAWAHDAPLDAYDRVVGANVLGETYPGLNSTADRRAADLPLTGPTVSGLALVAGTGPKTASLIGDSARLLVVLNRTGSIELTIHLTCPAGRFTVRWDDDTLVDQACAGELEVHATTTHLVRGANDLVIRAPPGTVIRPVHVTASSIEGSRATTAR